MVVTTANRCLLDVMFFVRISTVLILFFFAIFSAVIR